MHLTEGYTHSMKQSKNNQLEQKVWTMCLTSYIKSAVCFYNDAPNDTLEKERGGEVVNIRQT